MREKRRGHYVIAIIITICLATTTVCMPTQAKSNTYYINSMEEFLTFAKECTLDSYSRENTYILTCDLDMKDIEEEFTGIPIFLGTFDGQNHIISGCDITTAGSNQGFFRYVADGAVVSNLTIKGKVTPDGSKNQVGGIVGQNSGELVNCSFEGTVTGLDEIGGIAGVNTTTGKITNCNVSGEVFGAHQVGGITGKNSGIILQCQNAGAINVTLVEDTKTRSTKTTNLLETLTEEEQEESSEINIDEILVDIMDIGGIVGRSSGSVLQSVNYGEVGYESSGYNVGGIAGRQSGKLVDCTNEGKVYGRKDVGGIVGQLEPYTKQEMTQADLSAVQKEVDTFSALLNQTMVDIDSYTGEMYQVLADASQQNEETSEELETIQQQLTKAEEETNTTVSIDTDKYISSLNQISQNLSEVTIPSDKKELVQSDMVNLSNQISNIFGAFSGTVNHAIEELSSNENRIEDVSDSQQMDVGLVAGCSNRGNVLAETNTGGIAGIISMELTYDPDNTMSISALITSASKYLVYASVEKCESYADIQAKKECVGGIVGRMDYGAVKECLTAGDITCQTGDCVGGVAGLSEGSVDECHARVNLWGVNLVGGIVGEGRDINNCNSYTSIEKAEESFGTIAGVAKGEVENNYYVKEVGEKGSTGAIDNISYEGKAQGITYDEMVARTDVPNIFKTIEVTFVVDDKEIEKREVTFSEAVGALPEVEQKDGKYWVWESFDKEHIYYSMTIHGAYHKAITSLSTAEEVPQFLVEGTFHDAQELKAIPVNVTGVDEAYTLLVNDTSEILKVHAKTQKEGTLYVDNGDGAKETSYQRDGSYIVFEMQNGAMYQFVYGEKNETTMIIIILVGISLAGILVFVIMKKKRNSVKTDVEDKL